jgi:hypothetical protein
MNESKQPRIVIVHERKSLWTRARDALRAAFKNPAAATIAPVRRWKHGAGKTKPTLAKRRQYAHARRKARQSRPRAKARGRCLPQSTSN